jgi:hypothetical protein
MFSKAGRSTGGISHADERHSILVEGHYRGWKIMDYPINLITTNIKYV